MGRANLVGKQPKESLEVAHIRAPAGTGCANLSVNWYF